MAGTRRLRSLSASISDAVAAGVESPDTPLLVALSGGADSAVLLWALLELKREVRATHIHHGWPGSDRMEAAATEVAARLGMPLDVVRIDTTGDGSPEADARHGRYAALESARRPDELIATGHTATDQAETVVGNIMWGTGIDGLVGIRRSTASMVRPLLDCSRDDVRELAVLLGFPFADDPANGDDRFRRVRIRRALTAWETGLAPGVGGRLAALADLVGDDVALLDDAADVDGIEQDGQSVRIPVGIIRSVSEPIARRIVRRALRARLDGMPGSRNDVAAVLGVAAGGPPVEISGGDRVELRGVFVHIGSPEAPSAGKFAWDLVEPLVGDGWRWTSEWAVGCPAAFPFSPWVQVFDGVLFDAGALVRPVEAEDRISIRGGHKSVSDALGEAGVDAERRSGWPALVVGDDIVWLPGVRRADTGWVTAATERYLVVSAQREGRWKPVAY